jgi:hypothetical protein
MNSELKLKNWWSRKCEFYFEVELYTSLHEISSDINEINGTTDDKEIFYFG